MATTGDQLGAADVSDGAGNVESLKSKATSGVGSPTASCCSGDDGPSGRRGGNRSGNHDNPTKGEHNIVKSPYNFSVKRTASKSSMNSLCNFDSDEEFEQDSIDDDVYDDA